MSACIRVDRLRHRVEHDLGHLDGGTTTTTSGTTSTTTTRAIPEPTTTTKPGRGRPKH